jgi:hypothetical protein
MRVDKRKPKPHEAAMNRQIAVIAGRHGSVIASGVDRGEKSHTPPPREMGAMRLAEVW